LPRTTFPKFLRGFLWLEAGLCTLLALALVWLGGGAAKAGPIDSLYDKSCTSSGCHDTGHSDPGIIRHPSFLEKWCDHCHTDHQSQEPMFLISQPPGLCLTCHTDIEAVGHNMAHPPGSSSCIECHTPHLSPIRHLLRDEEVKRGCNQCHEGDLKREAEKPYRHRHFDPNNECSSCHYAHTGSEESFLRANLGETCLTCHDMALRSRGRSLENVGFQIKHAAHVHEPLREDMCHACHTPHGALQPSLLKDNYPVGDYSKYQRENYNLCWTCHDADMVEMPETREATGFRDGSTNLHSIHVQKVGRGRACHLCHTAHASERPHLLRTTILFRNWESDFDFEMSSDGGNCTTACHRPKEYRRSKP
jgi:predicted CXXCH cytochrome family protein